jgi:hypothetical protein
VRALGLCAGLCLAASAAAVEPPTPSPSPSPSASPEPSPPPPRLRLDIERLVERAVPIDTEPPRFATSVDVDAQSAQGALDRQLQGQNLECGPADGVGAPSGAEMDAVRPHLPPSADFLGLGKWIKGKLNKGNEPARYFLYRVVTAKGATFSLRLGPVPAALLGVAGTTFELVATFPDQGSATRAWQRLEQGFTTVRPSPSPSWAASRCQPPKD